MGVSVESCRHCRVALRTDGTRSWCIEPDCHSIGLAQMYGALNGASAEIEAAMAFLLAEGSCDALRLWGRLEHVKKDCDKARDFVLENRQRIFINRR